MKCIAKAVWDDFKHSIILEPAHSHDVAAFDTLHRGNEYKVVVTQARNIGHHRKAFALLQMVFENQDIYDNIEDLLVEFKLKSGHYREHITTKGKLIYVPKSLAFENLDQTAFEEIYSKFITIAMESFGLDEAYQFD